MGCPGCGGKGKSPGGTFGHILGCGTSYGPAKADKPGKDDRWNTFGIDEQRGILKHALQDTGLDPKVADTFAKNLRGVLDEHFKDCKDALPGTCKHVS